ncbi:hypothetical protein [Thermosipho sp. 1244]|uniref:hypothetical protein n=1 Tax=Thermosipho sp. 1244 TaxID=1755816 RepID=UPI001BDEA718|nr:hypothetical protein [Thermosipho sp. 1244]MBT1247352.1 hypothetical protein [Thermosipho sp. 1244]
MGALYFKRVPSLRDFHYRLLQLEEVIKLLIKFIHDELQEDIQSVIVDGTGIGFKKQTSLHWMRGTYVRQVKNHVRCEVILTKGKYKLFQYVEVDKAYSSEIKLLKKILSKIKLKGKKFIADKLYDVKRKKNSLRKQPLEKDYKQRNEIFIWKHKNKTWWICLCLQRRYGKNIGSIKVFNLQFVCSNFFVYC